MNVDTPASRQIEPFEIYTESADDLYENAPCAYVTNAATGRIGRVNRTFSAMTGYTPSDVVGRRRFSELFTKSGQVYFETHLRPLLDTVGAFSEIALDLVTAQAERVPVLVNGMTRIDERGRSIYRFIVVDARDRRAYERALLEERLRAEHLARLTAQLLEAQDEAAAAAAIAELGPRTFGSEFARLVVFDDRRSNSLHRSEADALVRFLEMIPTNEAMVNVPFTPHADGAEESVWLCAVPVRTATLPTGWLVAGFSAESPSEPLADRPLSSVALQLGVVLERIALEREHLATSLRLQQALLPRSVVMVPGIEVSAEYRPGTAALKVGGDWYDSYVLDDGRVGFVVGDVVGHGIDAAAQMGALRHAFAAIVRFSGSPEEALDRLHDYARDSGIDFSTACYAVLDPSTRALRYASAGHPPPLVLDPDKTTAWLDDAQSPPLYGSRTLVRTGSTRSLPLGATVVLFTDGLIERRHETFEIGQVRLARLVADAADVASVDEFTRSLVDRLETENPFADDVALLCVRVEKPDRLRLTQSARPEALREIRQAVRWWCRLQGICTADADRLVLLVGELTANSVEHGYHRRKETYLDNQSPADLTVELDLREAHVYVRVEDCGSWRFESSGSDRGHGLRIVDHMTHDLVVDTTATGTAVSFRFELAAKEGKR